MSHHQNSDRLKRSSLSDRFSQLIAGRSIPTSGLLKTALFGAIGCAVGALLAEALYTISPAGSGQKQAIVQVIDVSRSMRDKIDAVKSAAKQFSHDTLESVRSDGGSARIAVVAFSNAARVASPLTGDEPALEAVIEGLRIEGGTMIGRGLESAETVLQGLPADERRVILIFSDGQSTDQAGAEAVARRLRDSGTRLVAISTDGASLHDLESLTGDPSLVVPTSVDRIAAAFQDVRKKIGSGQFASNVKYGWLTALVLSAALGGLMGVGLSTALTVSQILSIKGDLGANRLKIRSAAIAGLSAGLVAAVAGQVLFLLASEVPFLGALGSWFGWCLMGGLLGMGIAKAIPNLDRRRGTLGGGLGGFIGGLGFLIVAAMLADTLGRMVGAAILGFAVGMMIVLVDRLTSEAWLVLRWGNEQGTIGLGDTPIILGSSREAHVRLDPALGYPAHYASIELRDGRVELKEAASGKVHRLADGNKLPLGKVEIEVKTA